jgi:uncharacterized protein YbjT (DUF2867 family)
MAVSRLEKAGLVVYLSSARLQHNEEGATEGVWRDVERLIEASGVDWTFVRAGDVERAAARYGASVAGRSSGIRSTRASPMTVTAGLTSRAADGCR